MQRAGLYRAVHSGSTPAIGIGPLNSLMNAVLSVGFTSTSARCIFRMRLPNVDGAGAGNSCRWNDRDIQQELVGPMSTGNTTSVDTQNRPLMDT